MLAEMSISHLLKISLLRLGLKILTIWLTPSNPAHSESNVPKLARKCKIANFKPCQRLNHVLNGAINAYLEYAKLEEKMTTIYLITNYHKLCVC